MSVFQKALESEAGDVLAKFVKIEANVSAMTYSLLMQSAIACHTDGETVVKTIFASEGWKERGNIAQCAATARVNAPCISIKFGEVIGEILSTNDGCSLVEAGKLLEAELSFHGFSKLHHFKTFSKDGLSPNESKFKAVNDAKLQKVKEDAAKEAQQRALDAAEKRAAEAEAALLAAPAPAPEAIPELGIDLAPNATPFPVTVLPAKVDPLVEEEQEQAPEVYQAVELETLSPANLVKAFALLDNPEFFEAYNAIKAMADERRKAMKKAA